MIKYFVWVPSSLGLVAQIWHDIQTDGNGKNQSTIALAVYDTRSIEELKRDYPYEK